MVKRIYTGHMSQNGDRAEELDDSIADLDCLLQLVVTRISEFVEVERTTLFLYDEANGELWSKVAEGTDGESKEIRVKLGQGIAGAVMKSGETLNIRDAYNDPRFNRAVDEKSGFITRTIFCRPLQDNKGNRVGVVQLLNKKGGDFAQKDEKLLDALCSQAVIAIENAQLYQHVKKLSDQEHKLNEELREKQKALQDAFLKMEEQNTSMRTNMNRRSLVRLVALFLIIGSLVGMGVYTYRYGLPTEAIGSFNFQDAEEAIPTHQNVFTVTPQSISSSIYLSGNLAPLELSAIPSPFQGKVKSLHFQYGEYVEQGQTLIVLDTTQVEVKLREAKTTLIKAQNELSKLKTWEQRSEVSNARRALFKAKRSLESQQQELKETQSLFGLGIIAKSEVESAQQQVEDLKMDLQAAQENLDTTIAQANIESIRIAEFDVKNAELEVNELEAKMSAAIIKAPLTGIVILPGAGIADSEGSDKKKGIELGSPVSEGDILLTIGNMNGLKVRSKVLERDISKIRHAQDVRITGEAFPGLTLPGKITYISSQAKVDQGAPIFEIEVTINALPPEQQKIVRLGMTVNQEVEVYRKNDAVMVPIRAVQIRDGARFVLKKPPDTAPPLEVMVETGVTNMDSVEILSGIQLGDEVVF